MPTMEKRVINPVAATFNCPELSLACIESLIIGEYTNQIFSTMFSSDRKIGLSVTGTSLN